MVTRIFLVLSVICLTGICKTVTSKCIDEEVESINGSFVSWIDSGEDYILSTPNCVNAEEKLVVRKCVDNRWTPDKDRLDKCEIVEPDFKFNDGGVMYKISEKKEEFNVKTLYYYKPFGHTLPKIDHDYWYHVKPLGKFHNSISLNPGSSFGNTSPPSGSMKNCLIKAPNDLIKEDKCDEEHYNIFEMSIYIRTSNCHSISGVFLYSQDICYGDLSSDNRNYVSFKSYMKKVYEMKLLLIQLNLENMYLYNATSIPGLDIRIVQDSKSFSIQNSTSKKNYMKYMKISEVGIKISLEVTKEYIEISCPNCKYAWNDDEEVYPGYSCFTNAFSSYISRIDLISRNSIDLHKEPGKAYYWCAGYTIFNTERFETQKVLAGRDDGNIQELAFYVTITVGSYKELEDFDQEIKYRLSGRGTTTTSTPITPNYPSTDSTLTLTSYSSSLRIISSTNSTTSPGTPTTTSSSTTIGNITSQANSKSFSFTNYGFIHPIQYVRTFEIADEEDSRVQVLCHIVTDKLTKKDEIFSILKMNFGSDFDGTLKNADFCEKDYINENIFWKKTKINEISTLNRINYRDSNGEIAVRKCLGSFLYGAEWEENTLKDLKPFPLNSTEYLENILEDLDSYTINEIINDLNYGTENISDSENFTPQNSVQISKILAYVAEHFDEIYFDREFWRSFTNVVDFILKQPPCIEVDCGNSSMVIVSSIDEVVDKHYVKDQEVDFIGTNFAIFPKNNTEKTFEISAINEYYYIKVSLPDGIPENAIILIKYYTNSNLFHVSNELPNKYKPDEVLTFSILNTTYSVNENDPVELSFRRSGLCSFWNDKWSLNSDIVSNVDRSSCKIVSLTHSLHLALLQGCDSETTVSINGNKLIWNSGTEFAVSTPLCEMEDHKILTKQCIEGQWIPKEKTERCTVLQATNKGFCPDGFMEYQEECVLINEKEEFSTKNMFFHRIPSAFVLEKEYSVWLPFKIFHPEKEFYPILSVNPGRYISPYLPKDKIIREAGKDCFIQLSNSIKVVSCDEKHYKLFSVENSSKSVLNNKIIVNQTFYFDVGAENHISIQNFQKFQNYMEIIYNDAYFKNTSTIPDVEIVFHKNSWSAEQALSSTEGPSITHLEKTGEEKFIFKQYSNYVHLTCNNCQLWIDQDGWSGLNCFTDAYSNYVENIEVFKISENKFKFYLHDVGFATYWCSATSVFEMEHLESEKEVFGNIPESFSDMVFVVEMNLTNISDMKELALKIQNILTPMYALYVRAFEVRKLNGTSKNSGNVLFHAGVQSITKFNNTLKEIFKTDYNGNLKSSEECFRESIPNDPNIFWKSTKINEFSTLSSRNYTVNGKHPKRKCSGSFIYGAYWEPFDYSKLEKSDDIYPTNELDDILQNINSTTPVETVDSLRNITNEYQGDLNSENFEQISMILSNVSQSISENITDIQGKEEELIKGVVSICGDLTQKPCTDCGNSTNEILVSIEDIIDDLFVIADTSDKFGVQSYTESNFSVFSIDPSKENVTGLKFYITNEGRNFTYIHIFKNTTFEEYASFSLDENLVLATYVPEDLLNNLSKSNININESLKIIIKVYRNDNLFRESLSARNNTKKAGNDVASITIPNYDTSNFKDHFIPLTVKFQDSNPECKYWNYTLSGWSQEGISFVGSTSNHLTCNISHLTSFTHLVDIGSSNKIINDFALDVITMICSSFSLIGLLGIFISALVLQNWRRTRSTQVLLQLCLASFFQIIIFFIISGDNFRGKYGLAVCATFGSMLHYTLLVQFMWMFVIGFSNWMMYNKPFNYLMEADKMSGFKTSAICWGVPLIPVISIVIFGIVESYESIDYNYDICFPNAAAKIWGFIVPVYTVLFINMVFYILLIIEFLKIRKNNNNVLKTKTDMQMMVRNLTILFFALGIPWIFGLLHVALAATAYPNFFSYLFVLTAPLQAFVLFIYFVILNPAVRREWLVCYQHWRYKDEEDIGVANKFLKILMHPTYKLKYNYPE